MRTLIFSLLAVLSISLSAHATEIDSLATDVELAQVESTDIITPDSLWDKANTAYINANYDQAIEIYESIVERGLSSERLFFNLGNAYYKRDDMARAILNYQKSLLISPNDEDTLYNLGVAQAQIKDQIEEIPEFFLKKWSRSISRAMGCGGWTSLSLAAMAVFFASLLAFMLAHSISLRKIGFSIGILAAILFTISTTYALSERREILEHNRAVVMSKSISIKSSPDKAATDIFILHSGTTVKILREMDNWYEIIIADGKKGWIESQRVERI